MSFTSLVSTLEWWSLRQVERTYDDIQKLRVALDARIKTTRFTVCGLNHLVPLKEKTRKACPICESPNIKIIEFTPQPVLNDVYEGLAGLEKQLYKTMHDLVGKNPLWVDYLSKVKGVGPRIASYLIVKLNPARFDTVSKMYKYCGMHVEDGKAPKRRAGEKTGWNPECRTMMWRLGEAFRMKGGFYKMMYNRFFAESSAKHPSWTKAHILADSRRRTVKLFLSHYLYVGRAILGLEPVLSYSCVSNPTLHHCIPPVLDKGSRREKETFYEQYLSKHFRKEDYEYWNKTLENWLGEREEEEEAEEAEEA
jgi:hypothetical protein